MAMLEQFAAMRLRGTGMSADTEQLILKVGNEQYLFCATVDLSGREHHLILGARSGMRGLACARRHPVSL